MTRLLVCDDSEETRATVRVLLEDHPDVEIVGEASNGEEGVALALDLSPDVVLMDVAMPVVDGVAATRQIRRLVPSARVVAFTGSDDADVVMAMTDAGASAYCVKGASLAELESAIGGAPDPLVRLAHALARNAHVGGCGELVARELVAATEATFAATYLAAPDVGFSLAGAAGSAREDTLASAPGLVLRSVADVALVRADARELAELAAAGCACSEALAVPLVADGHVLGAILIAVPLDGRFEPDPRGLWALADLAAAWVANERRLAMTHAEARRDALTGLPNRRAFEEHLDDALERARDRGREIAVALLDIDDFKQVNDTEGHAAGDRVLYELGRAALRTIRAGESLFRIGGEEFALVVEGGAAPAARVADRIRGEVSRHRRGRRLPTLSAGVAGAQARRATKYDLMTRADAALYEAKRSGKNRVFVVGDGPMGSAETAAERPWDVSGVGILLVDDDPMLRTLVRTTLEVIDVEIEEAETTRGAAAVIAERPPDVIVLDVGLPGQDGLAFCRELKLNPATAGIRVVLLTGSDTGTETAARLAGADAFLRKPFSPLDLLGLVQQLAEGRFDVPFRSVADASDEQLLLYAHDLRRLLEIERGQRALVQQAYRDTVGALAGALESKDVGTGAHSLRVHRYALELAGLVEPGLLEDPSLEYGFLLHDVGKIGVPDKILQKTAPLTPAERRLMQTHTVLGEQMLGEVSLIQGEGLRVVRSHHERWDGRGYPDALRGTDIPLGARVFAVADTLDAMTTDRPYRPAGSWDEAVAEILGEAEHQFDPEIVGVLSENEARLRRVHYELAA
jgi:diguanylate cyclase (GGDEF)-like protein